MDVKELYSKLPIILQNIACSLEGWRIKHFRYSGKFGDLLGEAEARSSWSHEQVEIYRDRLLRAFVEHCARTIPFYRTFFYNSELSPGDIQTLADLKHLPILTKQKMKDNYLNLVSDAFSKDRRITVHTSGTTGSGLRFAATTSAIKEKWAAKWRFRRWHGIQFDTWCGYFSGRSVVPLSQDRPPFWRYNYPGRQILFSGYHMNPGNLEAYVNELRSRKPPWLQGYPSQLSLLASYIVDRGAGLGYKPQWVVSSSENLTPRQVRVMEEAFGVRPIQRYSMAEAVAGASECEYGRLHVDEDLAAVEFIPNPDGPGYKVIGTGFTNPAVAFIRYDTGDLVTLSKETCPCGRPGRIIASIDGREEDYVILNDGTRIGRLDHIFKDMINIREAQIYQRRPGQMRLRVVRGEDYTDTDEDMLLKEVKERVGDKADVSIEYVERVKRSKSGKLRLVVSDVPGGKLDNLGVEAEEVAANAS